MKRLILFLFAYTFFHSFAQITPTDVKEFGRSLIINRSIYSGTSALEYEIISETFPTHSPLELKADLEQIGNNIQLFNKFCYWIVLNKNGNKELSGQILDAMCGNASLSLKIVDYIKNKFKDKLAIDIQAKKLQIKKDEAAQTQRDIEVAKENALEVQKQEERRIAKEKFEKENVPASLLSKGKNLQYPNISPPWPRGQVVAAFIIKTDGSVDSVRIISNDLIVIEPIGGKDVKEEYSPNNKELFNIEVWRYLQATKWVPALKDNKPAEEEKILPFKFSDNYE